MKNVFIFVASSLKLCSLTVLDVAAFIFFLVRFAINNLKAFARYDAKTSCGHLSFGTQGFNPLVLPALFKHSRVNIKGNDSKIKQDETNPRNVLPSNNVVKPCSVKGVLPFSSSCLREAAKCLGYCVEKCFNDSLHYVLPSLQGIWRLGMVSNSLKLFTH